MKTRRNLVTGVAAVALVLLPASGGALTALAGDQPAGSAWSVPGPAGRPVRAVRLGQHHHQELEEEPGR
jgi:hypothetical protein